LVFAAAAAPVKYNHVKHAPPLISGKLGKEFTKSRSDAMAAAIKGIVIIGLAKTKAAVPAPDAADKVTDATFLIP
jgi:hypothetical protein